MIEQLVTFALKNRFLVLASVIMLLVWGGISFHNLPVDAYPDVADNYVNIITQWPGRAAEEVEQQVTIPLEIVMNGMPHLEHLRSTTLFGLSSIARYDPELWIAALDVNNSQLAVPIEATLDIALDALPELILDALIH